MLRRSAKHPACRRRQPPAPTRLEQADGEGWVRLRGDEQSEGLVQVLALGQQRLHLRVLGWWWGGQEAWGMGGCKGELHSL